MTYRDEILPDDFWKYMDSKIGEAQEKRTDNKERVNEEAGVRVDREAVDPVAEMVFGLSSKYLGGDISDADLVRGLQGIWDAAMAFSAEARKKDTAYLVTSGCSRTALKLFVHALCQILEMKR